MGPQPIHDNKFPTWRRHNCEGYGRTGRAERGRRCLSRSSNPWIRQRRSVDCLVSRAEADDDGRTEDGYSKQGEARTGGDVLHDFNAHPSYVGD